MKPPPSPFNLTLKMPDIRTIEFRTRLDRALSWLHHCQVCGAIRPPVDFVCEDCEMELGKLMNSPACLRQSDYPFPVYSLFTWTEETDPWLRPILYGLKQGRAPRVLKRWLSDLSERRQLAGASPYRPIFLCPPRKGSSPDRPVRDHGWILNHLLAKHWRTHVYDGFSQLPERDFTASSARRRVAVLKQFFWGSGTQKQKTQGERLSMRFEARGELKEFHELRATVFADDVITTGATALAAYLALEDPHSFEVWTLACRPKLARFV